MADTKKKFTKKTNNKVAPKKPTQKRAVILSADAIGPFYEYSMGRDAAHAITHDIDGKLLKEAKGREQEYLVEFINDQESIMGTCVRVNVI